MTPRQALPSLFSLWDRRRRVASFAGYVWNQFNEDQGFVWAGLLSYATLLALVPLVAVSVAIITVFPVFDLWSAEVQEFIFNNFVPAAGSTVQLYINQFAEQASQLTAASSLFLAMTALLLMSEVEGALNEIWHVKSQRPLANRLVMYWAALTMGPLLIGASLAMTSYLFSLPGVSSAFGLGGVKALLLQVVPILAETLAFMLLFLLVPNRTVRLSHALVGAVVAAIMFEIAKYGFALYVANFPTYQKVYGTVAAIPLFLLWMYMSWVIILIGASTASAMSSYQFRHRQTGWPKDQEFLLLYRLIGHLWDAQRDGAGLHGSELLAKEPEASDAQIQNLLENLRRSKIVRRAETGDWILARDPARLTLLDLYRTGHFVLPLSYDQPRADEVGDSWDRSLAKCIEALAVPVEQHLAQNLKVFYEPEGEPVKKAPDSPLSNPVT